MASAAIFSSLRRRRSPSLEAFLVPVDLSEVALLETLISVSGDVVSCFSDNRFPFQRRNSRALVGKVEIFRSMLECLRDSADGGVLNPTAALCLKELYLLLYRSKILLDYCARSSKLWLLLQNHCVSGHFHDLSQEFSTLLDVFPVGEIGLSDDVREQAELLRRQSKRAKLFIDKKDDALRTRFYWFLDEFESGRVPDSKDLRCFFVDKLQMLDAKSCRVEVEALEEQIVNHEGDVEPTVPVLNGMVAITRYCRFLLFGFEEEFEIEIQKRARKRLITQEIAETFFTVPKDFCCPITLDLMCDPVIISTGQTYDRRSIWRWMEEGHCTCPKTGILLSHNRLVPNRALRNLIMQWCSAHGVPYDPPEGVDPSVEMFASACPSKASLVANRETAMLLIQQLADGSQVAKTVAAKEIRLLAKNGKENRAFIAQAGAIPHLRKLLSSPNAVAQENSVTALLNLSIFERNKSMIVEEGCLGSIVEVLQFGHTTEARENAAATLFSLSAVHEYKKRIADNVGAVEALAWLLQEGTQRGKKDAVTALFNLSTHTENCLRMIEAGAVKAMVLALGNEGVSEEAAGALALIVRQPVGAMAVVREEAAVGGLIGIMRCGTPRGKENAVAALLELCRSGGATATERVVRAPALAGLLQTLLFTGTKRARRKAASLARVFQRCENASLHYGGLGVGYAFASDSASTRNTTNFVSDVSLPMSISVPVL
ncbi:U-box domain-containing protein 17-like [Vigna unguiculata]|uniref:U-box domain-containing protein 17-like n=1 Tax=Vigna unguiculata TaxID=3917 RepID=UPI0010162C58|nr:U-box domain-containing protein 17-like [Vigna unguiculata]